MSQIALETVHFQRGKVNLLDPDDTKAIRTLPDLVDFNANYNPDHVFCYQLSANKDHSSIDSIPITYTQFRHAILRCARHLKEENEGIHTPKINENGEVTKSGPVVLFMKSEIDLFIHVLALMTLGVPVAVFSARLSPTAVRHLLSAIQATAIISASGLARTVHDAIAQDEPTKALHSLLRVYTKKDWEQDIDTTGGEVQLNGHFVKETDRKVLILHSSGTTGLPKPIYHPHRYLLGFTQCHQLEPEDIKGVVLSALPLFHGFGLLAPCLALGAGKPFMLPPPSTVPTGPSIVEFVRSFGPQALMTVPHILEEIISLPPNEGIQSVTHLQFVLSGGGPLKLSVAEKLANSGVSLLAHFGTTECGPLGVVFLPTPEYDWHFWQLRQDIKYSLEEVNSSNGGASPSENRQYKLVVHPFGWEEEFELQDILISRGGQYHHHLRAAGRKDDLIVLGNGEKINPQILESLLTQDERVKSAVAFGEGKFELGVIVEPAVAVDDVEAFKLALWPIIVEAGNHMDSHARISSRDILIVASPDKPIPRSDKGSVLRRETYHTFDIEIQRAYSELLNASVESDSPLLDINCLKASLESLIRRELGWKIPDSEWDLDGDLFELGMNSLQATQLHRLLSRFLTQYYRVTVAIDFVYKNPTISKLTTAIRGVTSTDDPDVDDPNLEIEDFVNFHSLQTSQPAVVLLTGSTGNLGSNLLAHLVRSPKVKRVICLNRGKPDLVANNGQLVERQVKVAQGKGVHMSQKEQSKIDVIVCDPSGESLGLTEQVYSRLTMDVTHILHNAWPMDFKRGLTSFISQFRYLNNLLRLALDLRNNRPGIKPRILFISSIAVVGQYPRAHRSRIIPEVTASKSTVIDDFGYGNAKLVCESIMLSAAKTFGNEMELAIVRVGQMSGSSQSGYWNPKEHLPTLIKFSSYISSLPAIEGTLSWIPVDTAAAVLGDIILTPSSLSKDIFHLENPIRQSWQDMLATIASHLGTSTFPTQLPFDEWLHQVKIFIETQGTDNDKVLLTTLKDLFEKDFRRMATGKVILDTKNTRAISTTLQHIYEVSPQLVGKYISEWRKMGILE